MVPLQIRIFDICTWVVVHVVHMQSCQRTVAAKQFPRSLGPALVVDRLGVVRLLAQLA